MIARIWHGYTKPEHADSYESMLKPELLPGISKVKGYKHSYLLRSAKGADARHQSVKELAHPSGGAPNPATVLRVFIMRAGR